MPAPTYDEINETLCAEGQFFEIEVVDVRGIPTRVWKNAPRSLRDILLQSATAHGDRPFLRLDEELLTHGEHFEQVAALATALVERFGVEPGDRVAIAMRNVPEWSVAFFATTAIGAVAVPLNAFWNGAELAFGVADCGAEVLVLDGERIERLAPHLPELDGVTIIGTRQDDRKGTDPLPPTIDFGELVAGPAAGAGLPGVDIDPDSPAAILYTSGTTGHPKGVLGTHRNICSNLVALMFTSTRQALRDERALQPPATPPVTLGAIPLFHASGCYASLVGGAFFGTTIVFMRKWDPEVALDLIERYRVTALGGVPAMVWDIVNSPTLADRDLSSVTSLGGGGAASPPELLRRVHEELPGRGASTGYGMTETSAVVTFISGRDYDEHPGSVGVAAPVCEVRYVDDEGNDVPDGEPGEMWVKGPNVVPGYWNRPEANAETFTDGWVHTGDIGRVDADGFVYIVDRAKDVIIRGGENISSLEVEAALYEHPAVLDVAVFAVPHDTLGEEVGAAVRLRPGATVDEEALRAHAASLLSPYKVPSEIWLLDDPFPRSPTGKLLKREMKSELLTGR